MVVINEWCPKYADFSQWKIGPCDEYRAVFPANKKFRQRGYARKALDYSFFVKLIFQGA
jgi:hypothetical protein